MNTDHNEKGRTGDDPARPDPRQGERPFSDADRRLAEQCQNNTVRGRSHTDGFRRRGLAAARLGIMDEWRERGREFCDGPSTFGLSPRELHVERRRLAQWGWTRAELRQVLAPWDAA